MAIFELSEEKYSNGRRPFTAILYELQPPECVVNDVGTKYNKNGITFLEEYASKHNTYNPNQKNNFLNMVDDFKQYQKRMAVA